MRALERKEANSIKKRQTIKSRNNVTIPTPQATVRLITTSTGRRSYKISICRTKEREEKIIERGR